MATPFGHSLIAGVFYLGTKRRSSASKSFDWRLFLFALFMVNAPDLDILADVISGGGTQLHHGPTHSFVFAIPVALIVSIVLKKYAKWFPQLSFLRLLIMSYALYISHVVVDLVTLDNGIPYGMPLVWPLSNSYTTIPIYVIPNVLHGGGGILSVHNASVILREFVLFTPVMLYFFLSARGLLKDRQNSIRLVLSTITASILVLVTRLNPFF